MNKAVQGWDLMRSICSFHPYARTGPWSAPNSRGRTVERSPVSAQSASHSHCLHRHPAPSASDKNALSFYTFVAQISGCESYKGPYAFVRLSANFIFKSTGLSYVKCDIGCVKRCGRIQFRFVSVKCDTCFRWSSNSTWSILSKISRHRIKIDLWQNIDLTENSNIYLIHV